MPASRSLLVTTSSSCRVERLSALVLASIHTGNIAIYEALKRNSTLADFCDAIALNLTFDKVSQSSWSVAFFEAMRWPDENSAKGNDDTIIPDVEKL